VAVAVAVPEVAMMALIHMVRAVAVVVPVVLLPLQLAQEVCLEATAQRFSCFHLPVRLSIAKFFSVVVVQALMEAIQDQALMAEQEESEAYLMVQVRAVMVVMVVMAEIVVAVAVAQVVLPTVFMQKTLL
jgi:hypothetical protein